MCSCLQKNFERASPIECIVCSLMLLTVGYLLYLNHVLLFVIYINWLVFACFSFF